MSNTKFIVIVALLVVGFTITIHGIDKVPDYFVLKSEPNECPECPECPNIHCGFPLIHLTFDDVKIPEQEGFRYTKKADGEWKIDTNQTESTPCVFEEYAGENSKQIHMKREHTQKDIENIEAIHGVESVFPYDGKYTLTIRKGECFEWKDILPRILDMLNCCPTLSNDIDGMDNLGLFERTPSEEALKKRYEERYKND